MNLVFVREWQDDYFVQRLREMGIRIRETVCRLLVAEGAPLREAVRHAPDDTIYRLDEMLETHLFSFCNDWGRERCFLLIAEGLQEGKALFPPSASERDAEFLLIVDPIDGTRSLMHDKRSAWVLAGVAPFSETKPPTSRDIRVAVQTEIPTTRQGVASQLWAVTGRGAEGEMYDRSNGSRVPFAPSPSDRTSLVDGFAGFTKFFPEGKVRIAEIEWELFRRLLPPEALGRVFDDQYISTGGQLYELIVGHDLFVADIRSLLFLAGERVSLCAHPYDLCTESIAREAGVIVTDLEGKVLDFPLNTTTPLGWVGYANEELRRRIEPHLQSVLQTVAPPSKGADGEKDM